MILSLSVFDWSFTFTLLQKSLPVAAAPPSISTAVFLLCDCAKESSGHSHRPTHSAGQQFKICWQLMKIRARITAPIHAEIVGASPRRSASESKKRDFYPPTATLGMA
jgi:hypothetical protein